MKPAAGEHTRIRKQSQAIFLSTVLRRAPLVWCVCARSRTYMGLWLFLCVFFCFSHPITPFPNHIHTPTVLFTHQCIQPPPYQHNFQDLLYPTMQFNVLEDEEQSETTIYLPVTSWEDPVCVCLCASVCFKEGVGCSNAS